MLIERKSSELFWKLKHEKILTPANVVIKMLTGKRTALIWRNEIRKFKWKIKKGLSQNISTSNNNRILKYNHLILVKHYHLAHFPQLSKNIECYESPAHENAINNHILCISLFEFIQLYTLQSDFIVIKSLELILTDPSSSRKFQIFLLKEILFRLENPNGCMRCCLSSSFVTCFCGLSLSLSHSLIHMKFSMFFFSFCSL